MKADRPHLSLLVDKTRTGSAKQSRIGDVDGYFGLDLEVTVEVKDYPQQDAAVHAVLHYLAHVEQNPDAVERLLGFIVGHDPEHDSLAYDADDSEDSSN